ncbi:phosphatidic acid phosphatase type 2/haloperoxidase [Limtongia smithiae]|uniref:phosphatidic acid phosphatase type 2/haloperoxidase n=1 Tax=Limtongia smithiae TaxID=1125753 RepID=UPI0034CF078B
MTCPPPPPASLRFTHVYYDADDPLANAFAWVSLAPQTILVVYATMICSRREAETLLLLLGQLACEASNSVLKRIVRQDRPRYHDAHSPDSLGFGMPSAHAQFMGFYATYICLWMYFRAHHFTPAKRRSRTLALVLLTIAVCVSRVYLYYHTAGQVVIGLLLGTIEGALWCFGVALLRALGIIALLLDTPIARKWLIKDTAPYRAFVADEYVAWRRGVELTGEHAHAEDKAVRTA